MRRHVFSDYKLNYCKDFLCASPHLINWKKISNNSVQQIYVLGIHCCLDLIRLDYFWSQWQLHGLPVCFCMRPLTWWMEKNCPYNSRVSQCSKNLNQILTSFYKYRQTATAYTSCTVIKMFSSSFPPQNKNEIRNHLHLALARLACMFERWTWKEMYHSQPSLHLRYFLSTWSKSIRTDKNLTNTALPRHSTRQSKHLAFVGPSFRSPQNWLKQYTETKGTKDSNGKDQTTPCMRNPSKVYVMLKISIIHMYRIEVLSLKHFNTSNFLIWQSWTRLPSSTQEKWN